MSETKDREGDNWIKKRLPKSTSSDLGAQQTHTTCLWRVCVCRWMCFGPLLLVLIMATMLSTSASSESLSRSLFLIDYSWL